MMVNKKSIALAAAALFAGCSVMAQTSPIRPSYSYPSRVDTFGGAAAVQVGTSPVYVAPWASAAIGNDSNVLQSSSNEVDSPYEVYSAGVMAEARDANSVFQLGLFGSHGRYSDSSADNYTDSSLISSYDIALTPRNFLRANWNYVRGHEGRGTTDRPVSSGPDKYFISTPGFTYAFGAPGAQGRVELFASRAVKRYLNNEETTAESDRNTKDYGGAFYWRVMPKTHVLVEARGTDIRYLAEDSPLSSSESRYYGGITWEATALTSGTVKVGRLEKRFDSDKPSFTGSSWEGSVTWLPRTYSKVDLYSSRQTSESTGLGDFIVTDASGIVWTHAWNSVFSTEANARLQKDKYKGFDRNDETTGLGLRANYKFRRWMTLGAEFQHTTRDSNLSVYEYDKDVWLVSAKLSM